MEAPEEPLELADPKIDPELDVEPVDEVPLPDRPDPAPPIADAPDCEAPVDPCRTRKLFWT